MKDEHVGWLPFSLTVGFAAGLLCSLTCSACSACSNPSGWRAFFSLLGFGIPMLIAGAATTHSWHNDKKLMKVYGWTSSVLGTVFGICLLIFVAFWVSNEGESADGLYLFGFGLPMIILGCSGLCILRPKTYRKWDE